VHELFEADTASVAGAVVFTAMAVWWGVRHLGPAWRSRSRKV
jgi:hypothetical protein